MYVSEADRLHGLRMWESLSTSAIATANASKQGEIDGAGVIVMNMARTHMLIVYQRQSGKWGFPKGHAHPKETLLECALRELYEETGLLLLQCEDYQFISNPIVLFHKLFYIATIQEEHLTYGSASAAEEIGATYWLPIGQLFTFMQKHPCNRTIREFARIIAAFFLENQSPTSFWQYRPEAHLFGLKKMYLHF